MRFAVFAFALTLCLAAPALADEGPVVVQLKDGQTVRGTLLGFGERIFKVQVGDRVVDVPERDVASIAFGPKAKPKRAKPAVELKHSPPANVKAEPVRGGVAISWESSPDNQYVLVTSYEVWRTDAQGEERILARHTDPSEGTLRWVDTEPLPGRVFRYKVVSVAEADDENPAINGLFLSLPAEQTRQASPLTEGVQAMPGYAFRVISITTKPKQTAWIRVWSLADPENLEKVDVRDLARGDAVHGPDDEPTGWSLVSARLLAEDGRLQQVATLQNGSATITVTEEVPPAVSRLDSGRKRALLVPSTKRPAHPKETQQALLSTDPVTVDWVDRPVHEAAAELKRLCGIEAMVSALVDRYATVSLRLRGLPRRNFIALLARATGLQLKIEDGGIYLHPKDELVWSPPREDHAPALEQALQRTWTFDLRDIYLEEAFALLSERSGLDIVLSPEAQKSARAALTIQHILRGRDLPLRMVLTHLARSAWMVWGIENGVVYVAHPKESLARAIDGFELKIGFRDRELRDVWRDLRVHTGLPFWVPNRGPERLTLAEGHRPLREVLDAVAAVAPGLAWVIRDGNIHLDRAKPLPAREPVEPAPTARPAVDPDTSSKEGAARSLIEACLASDAASFEKLLSRRLKLAHQGKLPELFRAWQLRLRLFSGGDFSEPWPPTVKGISEKVRFGQERGAWKLDDGQVQPVPEAVLRQLIQAQTLYLLQVLRRQKARTGSYPASLAELAFHKSLDPWDRPYVVRLGEEPPLELVTLGSDGAEGGEGEAADVSTRTLYPTFHADAVQDAREGLARMAKLLDDFRASKYSTRKGLYPTSLKTFMSGGHDPAFDPWTRNNFVYETLDGGNAYRLLSYGADGRPGGTGEDADLIAPGSKGETPKVQPKTYGERRARVVEDLRAIVVALIRYQAVYNTLPAKLSDLRRRYLSREPVDPWGAPYHYELTEGGNDIDLLSLGADGQRGGEGEGQDLMVKQLFPDKRYLPRSMKGWELYVWEGQEWCLVHGTNRIKTVAEVKAASAPHQDGLRRLRFKGLSQLERWLGYLPKGTEVYWGSKAPGWNDADVEAAALIAPVDLGARLEKIKALCARRGVELTVE